MKSSNGMRSRLIFLLAFVGAAFGIACSSTIAGHGGEAGTDASFGDTVADSTMFGDSASRPDASCSLASVYTYGRSGGSLTYEDVTSLTPPSRYRRTRVSEAGPPSASCSQTIPACGGPGITVGDLTLALQDGEVQAAFDLPLGTVFGIDPGPSGTLFGLRRGDGRGFLVGNECIASVSCRDIPAGIAALLTLLQRLDIQELALAGCEAFR